MLQDRIAAAEAAMGSQKAQASSFTATSGPGDAMAGAPSVSKGSSSSGSGKVSPISWYGRRSRSGSAIGGGGKTSFAAASSSAAGAEPVDGGKTTHAEPPLEHPMSADEARGFGPDGNGGVEGQPYTPTSEDQMT